MQPEESVHLWMGKQMYLLIKNQKKMTPGGIVAGHTNFVTSETPNVSSTSLYIKIIDSNLHQALHTTDSILKLVPALVPTL